ncbi:hypothetical protein N39L_38090 [Limnospira platensis NIES-39]|uniref:Uncharacterized protein n=1 Tax=Limnospira platensis NIES-46 TaxID=1236695 RepID=A0A5M3T1V6_LIMPL|nr:hypothetical protein N39L_38090 [Arthrospira platensis NIES-39]GCE92532.1 hypothetical protein NIES46_05720 [Arthrospira platensis NIES-46]
MLNCRRFIHERKSHELMNFVVGIKNTDYAASLEVRKIYPVLPDSKANSHQMLRIIDESGEDYLYPNAYFMPIELSASLQQVLEMS